MKLNKITHNCAYPFGLALEIHFQGCPHRCNGCYAKSTWSLNSGYKTNIPEIIKEVRISDHDGIVLIGGDPLFQKKNCLHLIKELRRIGEKRIWLYTGYTKIHINKDIIMKRIFNMCDVVITEPFDITKKQNGFIGSSNQKMWKNKIGRKRKNERGKK